MVSYRTLHSRWRSANPDSDTSAFTNDNPEPHDHIDKCPNRYCDDYADEDADVDGDAQSDKDDHPNTYAKPHTAADFDDAAIPYAAGDRYALAQPHDKSDNAKPLMVEGID